MLGGFSRTCVIGFRLGALGGSFGHSQIAATAREMFSSPKLIDLPGPWLKRKRRRNHPQEHDMQSAI